MRLPFWTNYRRNMSYKLTLKTTASIEIENVVAYYAAINIKLAKNLQSEIRRGFQYIVLYPESLQCRYDNIRIFWIENFPYGIYYFFDKEEVFIVAFWHEKEDIASKINTVL